MTYNGFFTKLMNFQECSICLEKMIFFTLRKKPMGFGIVRLNCGHHFHSRCMREILNWKSDGVCPLCRVDIFDIKETKLLSNFTRPNRNDLSDLSPERCARILKEAIRIHNTNLVSGLIEIFDPSEVIHHYIAIRDVEAIKQLTASKCINWQKTVDGKTLMDAAVETGDPQIKLLMRCNPYPKLSDHFLYASLS